MIYIHYSTALFPLTLESLHGFPGFPAGRTGLGLANYTVRFDNFKITGPDIPHRGGLSVTLQGKLTTTWGNLNQDQDSFWHPTELST